MAFVIGKGVCGIAPVDTAANTVKACDHLIWQFYEVHVVENFAAGACDLTQIFMCVCGRLRFLQVFRLNNERLTQPLPRNGQIG